MSLGENVYLLPGALDHPILDPAADCRCAERSSIFSTATKTRLPTQTEVLD